MSINTPSADSAETINASADAGVLQLEEGLKLAIRGDLLEASRIQGIIPTQQMIMQAEMLAAMATRAVLRRVQVIKARAVERIDLIEAFEKQAIAHAEASGDPVVGYYQSMVAPEFTGMIGDTIMAKGLVRNDTIEGDGARSYIGTVFLLPINPMEPPAKAPDYPRPPSIIRPV